MSGPEAQQPEPLCCKTNFLHGARACIFDDEGFPQTHPLIEVAGADLAAEIKCQNEYKYTYVCIYIYYLYIYIHRRMEKYWWAGSKSTCRKRLPCPILHAYCLTISSAFDLKVLAKDG